MLFDVVNGLSGKRTWEDDLSQVNDMTSQTAGKNAYRSTDAANEALWRALMGNRDQLGNTASSDFSRILDSLILTDPASPCPETSHELPLSRLWHVHLFFKRHLDFRLCGRPLREYSQDSDSLSTTADRREALMNHISKEGKQYFDPIMRMMEFMFHRRLAQTRDGYIAVVPSLAISGDVIAVLYGSGCPILLRRVEERYKVVAHCYVQGIMDGEVMDMIASGEKDLVDIEMS